jgi:hypothetical protein
MKNLGELVIAGAEAAATLDAAEEVFDLVAEPVIPPMKGGAEPFPVFGRHADANTLMMQTATERACSKKPGHRPTAFPLSRERGVEAGFRG